MYERFIAQTSVSACNDDDLAGKERNVGFGSEGGREWEHVVGGIG